jgi:hypothetical protein
MRAVPRRLGRYDRLAMRPTDSYDRGQMRRLGTVVLAALLIVGCGGESDTADFSNEASATCKWARRSVDVLPERTSKLLKSAAEDLRTIAAPDGQRSAAGTLMAELSHLSRPAGELASELDADSPDPARMRRLRAVVQDGQQKIAATARTLGVRGCDAITAVLLRDRAFAEASKRLSVAAYRTQLRDGLRDLPRGTYRVKAKMRSGTGSSSTLTKYAASVGTAVERLQPLRPPARVAAAHRDLVAGLRGLRTVIARVARDLRAGDRQRALQVLEHFFASQAFRDFTAATATLTRSGYLPG